MRAWLVDAINIEYLQKVTDGRIVEEINPETGDILVGLNFPGPDGVARVSEGDYLVMTEKNSFQRWSAKAFKERFEVKS